MLSQLTTQHALAAEQGLPPFVRRDWLEAARAIFESVELESGCGTASSDEHSGSQHAAGPELYGEMEFESLAVALETIRANHGGMAGAPGTETFVDIGSGSGLPVIAAAALHPWQSSLGIEIAPALHNVALANTTRWLKRRGGARESEDCSDVRFVCADALSGADKAANDIYRTADVMLCLCTAFPTPMMAALAERLAQAKAGAFLLTSTIFLPSSVWTVVEVLYLPMSWGATKIYIHRKAEDYPRWRELHRPQLAAMGLPLPLWRDLHVAVREQRFEAARWVQLAEEEDGGLCVIGATDLRPCTVSTEEEGGASDQHGLFLVDHAWSFATLADAEQSLQTVPGLLQRAGSLLLPPEGSDGKAPAADEGLQALVMAKLEGRVGVYRTATAAGAAARFTFFIGDEVGARLGQALDASDANYACRPLFALDEKMAFSVAWPLASIEQGEELLIADHSTGAAVEMKRQSAATPTHNAPTIEDLGVSPEMLEFQVCTTVLAGQSPRNSRAQH